MAGQLTDMKLQKRCRAVVSAANHAVERTGTALSCGAAAHLTKRYAAQANAAGFGRFGT